jgi:hypothetical protein
MAKRNIYTAIENDKYITYDEFVGFLKDFYAPDDDEKAYDVEDFVNAELSKMFDKLNEKFLDK